MIQNKTLDIKIIFKTYLKNIYKKKQVKTSQFPK